MQESNPTHDPPAANPVAFAHRRLILLLAAALALLLLLFLPPYINVSRYQRGVDRNISAALGRPVHFDRITLALLPLPGFTLENFVVDEDPAFGSEPILRADEVRASLRLSSLWSHRVEFSRIALTEPSVNLVRSAEGHWNIEDLLLQASRAQAAPTAQTFAGPAPRFPYIEATGARLNFKLGLEKTPISLTDADFALWLPQPHQWRLRLEAHPVRTDTGPADTGTLRIEATLGAPGATAANPPADPLSASLANLTIDLHGEWQDVQLGGLSRLLAARDAGLRGDLDLTLNLLGTLRRNALAATIQLSNARRADFVPPRLLSIQAECHASAQNTFHSFANVACNWPPSSSSDPRLLALTANIPDIRQLRASSATLTLPNIPAETFLDWLSVATSRPPTGLTGHGTLAGSILWNADALPASAPAPDSIQPHSIQPPPAQRHSPPQRQSTPPLPAWSGQIEFSNELLQLPALGPNPIPLGTLLLRATPPPATHSHTRSGTDPETRSASAFSFDLLPLSLPLGGKQSATLDGHVDASGYSLHIAGTALPDRLRALGDAIPQLGDGLRQILEPPPPDEAAQPTLLSEKRSAQPLPPNQSNASAAAEPQPQPQSQSQTQPQSQSREPADPPIHIDLTATHAWGDPTGPPVLRP